LRRLGAKQMSARITLFCAITLILGVPALWSADLQEPRGTGGPDAFGYEWIDSNEPGGPSFQWVDLLSSGVVIDGFGDDNYQGPFPIGFDFLFYGVTQTAFYVSSNGYITFTETPSIYDNHCPIPTEGGPNNLVAIMWDDLDPGDFADVAYYQHFAEHPEFGECLVVEFSGWRHYPGSDDISSGTWEVILRANSDIVLQYLDPGAESAAEATIGIENSTGLIGLTYDCNQVSIAADFAVHFSMTPGIYLPDSVGNGNSGSTVIHSLRVINQIGEADSFDLNPQPSDWNATFYRDGLPITDTGLVPDGGAVSFEVWVEIPGSAVLGDSDLFVFQAISQTLPGSFSATCTVQTLASNFHQDWVSIDSLNVARTRTCMNAVDDQVYIIGGESPDKDFLGSVEKYDPVADSWSIIAGSKPSPGSNFCSTALESDIYVPGGYSGSILTDLDVFHTTSETWEAIATDPVPVPRMGAGCGVIDGILYLYGGENSSEARPDCYAYDPAAAPGTRWTQKSPMTTARSFFGYATFQEKLYAIGGLSDSGEISSIEEYDPISDTWTEIGNLPEPWAGGSAVAFDADAYDEDQFIILVGGGWATHSPTCLAYRPDAGIFIEYPSLITGRSVAGAVRTSEFIYTAGGSDGSVLDVAEKIPLVQSVEPCINNGDVNLDGEITAGDALLAFQISLGVFPPPIPYQQLCAADCNGDEIVTAGDAQAIFLTALGLGSCADPVSI